MYSEFNFLGTFSLSPPAAVNGDDDLQVCLTHLGQHHQAGEEDGQHQAHSGHRHLVPQPQHPPGKQRPAVLFVICRGLIAGHIFQVQ